MRTVKHHISLSHVVASVYALSRHYIIPTMRSTRVFILLFGLVSAHDAFVLRPTPSQVTRKASFHLPAVDSKDTANDDDQDEDAEQKIQVPPPMQEPPQPIETRGGGGSGIVKLPSSLPPLPTMAAYRKFALPCLGLWVSGPLLSLVDTGFVGLSGASAKSAEQLAALGPATTFFDGATYLFAFLNVATTNLYASARAKAGDHSDKAESVVRTASRVALYCGLGLMMLLFACARPLLALYIGPEAAATPGLLDDAVAYVKIRALSMPSSLVLGVLQAALLGAKDSVTPLIAILYSTIVNVVGDFILVNRLELGLPGASIATTLAQWTATIALVGPARRELVSNGQLEILRKKTKVEGGVTGRSFLGFAAPVLTLILGKIAAFGFMTHTAAALPGQPVTLAAHQIILSLFFFVSPFLEVISQTAQTFLPPYFAPVKDYIASRQKNDPSYDVQNDVKAQEWLNAAFTVGTRLLGLGMSVACVVATLASLIPAFFGGALTSDVAVQQAVKPLAPFLFAGAFLTAPVAVSEGVLLARRELKFLASVYLVSTTLLPPALLRIKKLQEPVTYVWGAFAVFQLFRTVCFTGRIWGGRLASKVVGGGSTPEEEG